MDDLNDSLRMVAAINMVTANKKQDVAQWAAAQEFPWRAPTQMADLCVYAIGKPETRATGT